MTYKSQAVDSFLVASGERIQVILSKSHYKTRCREAHTLDVDEIPSGNRVKTRGNCPQLTGSESSIMLTIRSAHSVTGRTVGCLRYIRRRVKAAFFFTKVLEVLRGVNDMSAPSRVTAFQSKAHALINSLWTSPLSASAISFPPMFAMACRARQLLISLASSRSFLIEFMTKRMRSEFSCKRRVRAR